MINEFGFTKSSPNPFKVFDYNYLKETASATKQLSKSYWRLEDKTKTCSHLFEMWYIKH